jgi:AraC-like DNA-binding protein
MKLQLEAIRTVEGSSFHLMRNPRLNDLFFWHSHPEYELVHIEGANGTRHVGTHISRYEGSDLVFIGSHIPHLNFDYGVQTDYTKTVLHIRRDFLKDSFDNTPELEAIQQFFKKSAFGIAIHGATKAQAGQLLQQLHGMPPFEQFLAVLRLFFLLAQSTEIELLHDAPVENPFNQRAQERLRQVYRFIDAEYHRKIDISEIAAQCVMTEAAFCRYFKKMTQLTFTDFLNRYRINQAKHLLLSGQNVSETCYACGFESLSYFNRIFRRVTGNSPTGFKKEISP